MNKVLRLMIIFPLLVFSAVILSAAPPVFILGVYGGPEVTSEDSLPAEIAAQGRLEASLGWRNRFLDKGYVSLSSQVQTAVSSGLLVEDQEFFEAELFYQAGPGRIGMTAGFLSSVLGIEDSPGFFNPEWRLVYRLSPEKRKTGGKFEYIGYSLVEPLGSGDIFYQGARLTLDHRASLRFNFTASAGFGYEGWFETALFSDDGTLTADRRNDIIVDGNFVLNGLAGYFTEWTIPLRVLWRNSNANAFVPPDIFIPDSASRIQVSSAPVFTFSPHRSVNFSLNTSGEFHTYIERKAFDRTGALTGEPLRIVSTGGGFTLDWTGNNVIYLVLEGDGGYSWSNDPFETGWYFSVFGGVELSF